MSCHLKLIIFDLDGTLVDAYKGVASSINYTLTQMKYEQIDDETIKRAVGMGDRHLVRTFVAEEHADQSVEIFREHHASALKDGTIFLPGAQELLITLKEKKYPLAIATNRTARFTHIILEHLNIQDTFDYVLCGDEVARPKPEPDILEQILEKFAILPKEALYVGDMTIDVETGNKAQVRTVAVVTGSSTKEEIACLNPFKIIDRVSQVADIIEDIAVSSLS